MERPLRGLQLLAAVVSHCGTYIRITLQNVYKPLCMCSVNVACERKPICLGYGLSLITEISYVVSRKQKGYLWWGGVGFQPHRVKIHHSKLLY